MQNTCIHEQVQKAFELLNADKQVKTILVNIFGGIMRYLGHSCECVCIRAT